MPIPELAAKIDYLLREVAPTSVAASVESRAITNRGALAEAMGLSSRTNFNPSNGQLSPTVCGHLQRIYKIQHDSECWGEFMAGDKAEFIKEYEALHRETAVTKSYPPADRFPHAGQEARPEDGHPRLASVTLFIKQRGPGESVPISAELICQPEPIGGFEIAVHRGRLEIALGTALVDQSFAPLASEKPVELRFIDRVLTIQRANAMSGRIAWSVSNDKGAIGVLRLDEDVDLCWISNLLTGAIITGFFYAYIKDLDLEDPDPDEEKDDQQRLYSFLRPDGKPLSPTKRQLIKRAILKEELGPAPKGWHALAQDVWRHIGNDT